ncbi:methyltransferase [uncultured Pseudokineococcus sp.]|uniref:methyltransferase n=1 Tax=uncultured Pseudokineococcus sp. TaxID=1642928 RepID=UPI003456D351
MDRLRRPRRPAHHRPGPTADLAPATNTGTRGSPGPHRRRQHPHPHRVPAFRRTSPAHRHRRRAPHHRRGLPLQPQPQYTGAVAALTGAAAARRSPAALALTATLAATYRAWVPTEERHLSHHFGAPYRDYHARTPRWLGRPTVVDP